MKLKTLSMEAQPHRLTPEEKVLPPKQIPKRQTQDELLRKKKYLLNRIKRIYNLKKQEKTWMFEPRTYELVG